MTLAFGSPLLGGSCTARSIPIPTTTMSPSPLHLFGASHAVSQPFHAHQPLALLAGLDFGLIWDGGAVHAKLLDWNYQPSLCLQPSRCGVITMTMMAQVFQVLQQSSFADPFVGVDVSRIEGYRLETLLNASMPASWFCPMRH